MAAATALAIGSIALKGFSIFDSINQKNKAQRELDNFKRQDLINHAENIQISTKKSDLQTQANQVNLATSVNALQRLGTRGVLAGLPSLNDQNIRLQNSISQDLENQDLQRQRLILQQQQIIDNIRERRETGALAGLNNSVSEANQNIQTGIDGVFSSAIALDSSLKTSGSTFGNAFKTSKTSKADKKLFNSFNKSSDTIPLDSNPLTFNADLSPQEINPLYSIFN